MLELIFKTAFSFLLLLAVIKIQRIILFSLLSSLIFLIKIKTNMSQVITEVEQNLVSVQQGF